MIQLEGIPNLSGLVQSFDQQQLANFCRILSVTISEPDVGNDDKHTLLAKNAQQKRNASPSRAEVNQGRLSSEYRGQTDYIEYCVPLWTINTIIVSPTVTLLNIPGFIERLCKLATRKVSEATGANFLQELEDWYTWLDNALVLDALMQMATEEAEQSSTGETTATCAAVSSHRLNLMNFDWERLFSSPSESSDESSLATSPLRHRLPQSMKIVQEIMYKVEVLYVLCVLLMGRQRNQVLNSTHLFPPWWFKLECWV